MKNKVLFNDIYQNIEKAHYILIGIDESSSIDRIVSSLSLSNFLSNNRIKHKIFLEGKVPPKINFLEKFDKISSVLPKSYDLIIYMDSEMKNNDKIKNNESKEILLYEYFLDISSSEFFYNFYKSNSIKISKKIAECLYVGLVEYTAYFTNNKINKNIFEIISDLINSRIDTTSIHNNLKQRDSLAKFKAMSRIMSSLDLACEGKIATVFLDEKWIKETGISYFDCDDVVDSVISIGIVQVAAYFKIIDGIAVVILKSKKSFDLSIISKEYNGYGDYNNCYISIPLSSIANSKEKVISSILNYI